MRLALVSSVIAMTLAVTAPALADTSDTAPAPTAAAPTAPYAPAVVHAAAPAPVAVPNATPTTVATAPVVAAVAAAPAPAPARTVVMAPAAAPPAPAMPAAAPPAATVAVAAPAMVAVAAPAIAAPAVAAPMAPAELPLALRPSKALTLAETPAPTPWPYKIIFGAAVLAAGALVWKKRRALAAKRTPTTPVRVLGKTSMGLRGELALVEVGGMRLLIGVTPSSMQTLAVLPDDYAEVAEAEPMPVAATAREARASTAPRGENKLDLATRARALFSSLDMGPPVPPRVSASGFAASRYADERDIDSVPDSGTAPKAREQGRERERDTERRRRLVREVPLEGQARGIALALGNRK